MGVVATIMLLDARDDEFKERGRRLGPFFSLCCLLVRAAGLTGHFLSKRRTVRFQSVGYPSDIFLNTLKDFNVSGR